MESTAPFATSRALTARLDTLEERVAALGSGVVDRLDRTLQALEWLVDDDPQARRRLAELRSSPSYAEAYREPEPLVSIIIPTWNRTESLTTRSIPSVLAQTYANVEAVVVGDASPPELGEAVSAIGDSRVRFHNLTIRGPYDDDPLRAWCASGTPPMNAGLALATGHWVTAIGDDDALCPTHIENLLSFARTRRLEFACGWYRSIGPNGDPLLTGSFPPKLGHTGLQISLWHAGLRFLQFELAHALFMTPNDWGLIRRMMRIGVSMGQTDDVVVDYQASGRGLGFGAPAQDEATQMRHQITDLRDQLYELEAQREDLNARLSATVHSSELARDDVQRRLDDVVYSRSWRVTAPLRRMTEIRRRIRQRRR